MKNETTLVDEVTAYAKSGKVECPLCGDEKHKQVKVLCGNGHSPRRNRPCQRSNRYSI